MDFLPCFLMADWVVKLDPMSFAGVWTRAMFGEEPKAPKAIDSLVFVGWDCGAVCVGEMNEWC